MACKLLMTNLDIQQFNSDSYIFEVNSVVSLHDSKAKCIKHNKRCNSKIINDVKSSVLTVKKLRHWFFSVSKNAHWVKQLNKAKC